MQGECGNGDMRDQLPEYLNARLDAASRATIEAHLAACAACADELAFLQSARDSFETPIADIAAGVRASQQVRVVRHEPTARWGAWRVARWQIAAGVSFLLVGGVTLQLLRRGDASAAADRPMRDSVAAMVPSGVAPASSTALPAAETLAARTPTASAPARGALSDLTDEQLQQLLDAIDGADFVPGVETEARTAPIIAPAGRTGRIGGTQ